MSPAVTKCDNLHKLCAVPGSGSVSPYRCIAVSLFSSFPLGDIATGVTVICVPSEICFLLNKRSAITPELPVVLHPDAVTIICVSSEICFPSSKGPFPLIARINSQAHCEYFHPITMLESLF